MYAVIVDLLALTMSRKNAMRHAPYSLLSSPLREDALIIKGRAQPIGKRKLHLLSRAQVVRGPVSRPGHGHFFIYQRTSGT